ncbi:hypothetical protein AJ80_00469 [Polytolypa hystricis UAMH7299]|uniref:C2H2-type domain-containing protein n=1 Tax=Polytolypa hystricis (strain UAMH7299) TaxID=1447883 RepID=A0A2B7Z3V1_POLH7|nr:hypothetical protein AJ80_00469 [Polytolypa hystricis UAMH7299]
MRGYLVDVEESDLNSLGQLPVQPFPGHVGQHGSIQFSQLGSYAPGSMPFSHGVPRQVTEPASRALSPSPSPSSGAPVLTGTLEDYIPLPDSGAQAALNSSININPQLTQSAFSTTYPSMAGSTECLISYPSCYGDKFSQDHKFTCKWSTCSQPLRSEEDLALHYVQQHGAPLQIYTQLKSSDYPSPESASPARLPMSSAISTLLERPVGWKNDPRYFYSFQAPSEQQPQRDEPDLRPSTPPYHLSPMLPSPVARSSPHDTTSPMLITPMEDLPTHTAERNWTSGSAQPTRESPQPGFSPPDPSYEIMIHSDLPTWTEGSEFSPAIGRSTAKNWADLLANLRVSLSDIAGNNNRPMFAIRCFRGRDTLCITIKDPVKMNFPLLKAKAQEWKIPILLIRRGLKRSARSPQDEIANVDQSPTPIGRVSAPSGNLSTPKRARSNRKVSRPSSTAPSPMNDAYEGYRVAGNDDAVYRGPSPAPYFRQNHIEEAQNLTKLQIPPDNDFSYNVGLGFNCTALDGYNGPIEPVNRPHESPMIYTPNITHQSPALTPQSAYTFPEVMRTSNELSHALGLYPGGNSTQFGPSFGSPLKYMETRETEQAGSPASKASRNRKRAISSSSKGPSTVDDSEEQAAQYYTASLPFHSWPQHNHPPDLQNVPDDLSLGDWPKGLPYNGSSNREHGFYMGVGTNARSDTEGHGNPTLSNRGFNGARSSNLGPTAVIDSPRYGMRQTDSGVSIPRTEQHPTTHDYLGTRLEKKPSGVLNRKPSRTSRTSYKTHSRNPSAPSSLGSATLAPLFDGVIRSRSVSTPPRLMAVGMSRSHSRAGENPPPQRVKSVSNSKAPPLLPAPPGSISRKPGFDLALRGKTTHLRS